MQRILVFRIGQLGDTIAALPAMWVVRRRFPDASLTLLCDRHPQKQHVLAPDLLRGGGIFDAFESYVVDDTTAGKTARLLRMATLAMKLRRLRFDTLVYLAPSTRTPAQVERDRRFFRLAGITEFLGMRGFRELPRKTPGRPLASTPAESDLLLERLAADGLVVPAPQHGSLDLALGADEESAVQDWLRTLPGDGGRPWLAVGPGSKMPAKRWPEDRYAAVVTELIREFDVWPVVFGGPEDRALGENLLAGWHRGYNAAGALGLRAAAAALRRTVLYLGNDTGTMHLAAAAGCPCVALFSAREWPGMWHPYGVPCRVLRSEIECDGCGLMECRERGNECLNRITVAGVRSACADFLAPQNRTVTTSPARLVQRT